MTELQKGCAPKKGKYIGYIIVWLLGNGTLFSWNSVLTVEDYFGFVFPDYHPARVFTLVYQPFALATLSVLTVFEARVNTRKRILWGYGLFCLFVLAIPILDLATSGNGSIGVYIGICVFVAGFGVADACVQGGMFGDLSYMHPDFIQGFSVGLAMSGVLTSGLRFITKASFEDSQDGLRKGALLFFFISGLYEIVCFLLYAFVFPRLEIVKYYRSKAAEEGSQTVIADLTAAGVSTDGPLKDTEASAAFTRRTNVQLLMENWDYALVIVLTYVLSLSIFPGFLFEDTGEHSLGSWYAITLIAMFNCGDLIGRLLPHIKFLMFTSRPGLLALASARFALIPAFYFTAKYGSQGWMLLLCIILGLSNGYISVCTFVNAPTGYTGPEQNALGNILVTFLLVGIFAGVVLDWLWLIGKGW
ncbi:hypothetical protein R1sor_013582 [Riccia sorocarpa]|uniref:Equilibrative nucleoside transporter n=1 Tax=Riccia sorocarpa TaxID=122646 RepID=A0ABD3H6Z7_9MARC